MSNHAPDAGLRGVLRAKLRGVHWTSIETGATQRGVPDLHGCCQGADVWVECKAVKRGWAVHVRPAQVAWHLARSRHGGRSVLAVRRLAEGADELWLVAGWAAALLRTSGLPRACCPTPGLALGDPQDHPLAGGGAVLGAWAGGPSGWPWPQVLGLLAVAQ